MADYANQSKLLRAQKWAKEQGKEGDEAAIKARYVALGGLITGDDSEQEGGTSAKVNARMSRESLETIARAEGISDEDIAAAEEKGDLVELITTKREA